MKENCIRRHFDQKKTVVSILRPRSKTLGHLFWNSNAYFQTSCSSHWQPFLDCLSMKSSRYLFVYLKIITGSFRQCYVGQLIIHYTTGKKYINTFTKELRQYWSTIRVGYILPLVSSKHVSGSIHIASMEFTQNPGWM